jgi:phosphatidylinositol alpha-1,6-mannosyltransferase
VTDRIEFAGFVDDTDINAYYNLCDVLVMPNREESDGDIEGFGMTFLEASGVGKPVIGGRSGGAAETIVDGETGILIDPTDVDMLISGLETLLGDEELRKRMGIAGLKRVSAEFDWDSRAKLLHETALIVLSNIRSGRRR